MYKQDKLSAVIDLICMREKYADLSALSDELGYHKNYISNVRHGEGKVITEKFIGKLVWRFNVNKDFLTGDSNQPFTNDSMVLQEPAMQYGFTENSADYTAALKNIIEEKNTTISHLNNIIIRLEKEIGKKGS